jgi:tricarballylate dehydrogenase
MINRRGHRFVDEGEDGAMFTYAKYGRAILAEPGAKKEPRPVNHL